MMMVGYDREQLALLATDGPTRRSMARLAADFGKLLRQDINLLFDPSSVERAGGVLGQDPRIELVLRDQNALGKRT